MKSDGLSALNLLSIQFTSNRSRRESFITTIHRFITCVKQNMLYIEAYLSNYDIICYLIEFYHLLTSAEQALPENSKGYPN